jgi:hypothetical protein
LYRKEHKTDRRLACRLRLGKSSLFTQLKMTDRCCNTPIVKYSPLVDENNERPMSEFFFPLFFLQVYFLCVFFFFFSCLIEEKGLSHFLFIINHSRNEQQQQQVKRKKEEEEKTSCKQLTPFFLPLRPTRTIHSSQSH